MAQPIVTLAFLACLLPLGLPAFAIDPGTLRLDVSGDGTEFATATTSDRAPEEGAPYSAEPRRYAIGERGWYLRVKLGPSQHTGDRYYGLLELTETEVRGE